MRMNSVNALALLPIAAFSSFAAGGQPSSSHLEILSPPDRFFAASTLLDVTVSATPRPEDRRLLLRVDGSQREEVLLPAHAGAITHTFHMGVSPLDPPAFIEVCLSNRTAGAGSASCTSVRAAGPVEWQRLRETMEELETLGRAVYNYGRARNVYPETLGALVPDFLSVLPAASSLGLPIEYSAAGPRFRLATALPGSGTIRFEDGIFTAFPRGILTDREAARIIRSQVRDIAMALEEYRIDHSVYPPNLSDVTPVYARFLPTVDAYGRPYRVDLDPLSYSVSSPGRDGAPGGSGFDADTVMKAGLALDSTTPYVGEQEYVRHAFSSLLNAQIAIAGFVGQTGHLPATLAEAAEPIAAATRDLCGNPYTYRKFVGPVEEVYTLQAAGCDGTMGTDLTEATVHGSNLSTCRETPRPEALGLPKLFD